MKTILDADRNITVYTSLQEAARAVPAGVRKNVARVENTVDTES